MHPDVHPTAICIQQLSHVAIPARSSAIEAAIAIVCGRRLRPHETAAEARTLQLTSIQTVVPVGALENKQRHISGYFESDTQAVD